MPKGEAETAGGNMKARPVLREKNLTIEWDWGMVVSGQLCLVGLEFNGRLAPRSLARPAQLELLVKLIPIVLCQYFTNFVQS